MPCAAPEPGADEPPASLLVPGDICKHVIHGYCNWGSKCRFVHPQDRRAPEPVTATAGSESAAPSQKPTEATEEQALQEERGQEQEQGVWKWRRPPSRHWVHIFLHKRHADFDLVPMLIGRGGRNMTDIFTATNAKLRIRGRGSGHLEVEMVNGQKREAPVPLMVAVTADKSDAVGICRAVDMIIARLLEIQEHWRAFCEQRRVPSPAPDEPIFSFGEVGVPTLKLVQHLVNKYPHPDGPKSTKKVTPGGVAPGNISGRPDSLEQAQILAAMAATAADATRVQSNPRSRGRRRAQNVALEQQLAMQQSTQLAAAQQAAMQAMQEQDLWPIQAQQQWWEEQARQEQWAAQAAWQPGQPSSSSNPRSITTPGMPTVPTNDVGHQGYDHEEYAKVFQVAIEEFLSGVDNDLSD